jgi:hypothetical protein
MAPESVGQACGELRYIPAIASATMLGKILGA